MKRTWLVILVLLLLAAPAAVQGQYGYSTNADGSIYSYTTNADGSANIAGYAGPPWSVTIPTNINGLTVASIGNQAFYDLASLTNITIPSSVTNIGEYAFEYTHLNSVMIPSSVTSIGERAFFACLSLEAITVDAQNSFYSSLNGVLFDKPQATLIQFPAVLGGSYTIPGSVTSIGEGAFGSDSLTSVTIPGSITNIGTAAFSSCTGLTNVTIQNGVTSSIGEGAFTYCASLTSVVIGDGVTNIGENAFVGCSSLTSVTIPGSVTSIGDFAFFKCTCMTSVAIPDSVTTIGKAAFFECYGLTNITIPGSVASFGEGAFSGCTNLTTVTFGNRLTSVGDNAFDGCTSLTSVTIPASVTSIGSYAFKNCSSLTNVIIGKGVTSIGVSAFIPCTNLHCVYFMGNAPEIPDGAPFGNWLNIGTIRVSIMATYYLPGTTGWNLFYWGYYAAGPPAYMWNPLVLTGDPSFGVQSNQFGFTITNGTSAINLIAIVVEACTNLANPVWIPLTNVWITNGLFYFSDPQWTNYPARYYGIVFP